MQSSFLTTSRIARVYFLHMHCIATFLRCCYRVAFAQHLFSLALISMWNGITEALTTITDTHLVFAVIGHQISNLNFPNLHDVGFVGCSREGFILPNVFFLHLCAADTACSWFRYFFTAIHLAWWTYSLLSQHRNAYSFFLKKNKSNWNSHNNFNNFSWAV